MACKLTSKCVDVNNMTVTTTAETSGKKLGDAKDKANKITLSVQLDFSKVSRAAILMLAARTIIISYQSRLRNLDRAFVQTLAKETQLIDVSTFKESELTTPVTEFVTAYEKIFKDAIINKKTYGIIKAALEMAPDYRGEVPAFEEIESYMAAGKARNS